MSIDTQTSIWIASFPGPQHAWDLSTMYNDLIVFIQASPHLSPQLPDSDGCCGSQHFTERGLTKTGHDKVLTILYPEWNSKATNSTSKFNYYKKKLLCITTIYTQIFNIGSGYYKQRCM